MNIGDLQITNLCVGDIPALSACVGTEVVWNSGPEPEPDYRSMPLTLEILEDGYLELNLIQGDAMNYDINISYSKDGGGRWEHIDGEYDTHNTIRARAGREFIFQITENDYPVKSWGNATSQTLANATYWSFSGSSCTFKVKGNILSLLDMNYASATTFAQVNASAFTFIGLFRDCPGLVSAEHLILPNDFVDSCYGNMFKNSTGLTDAPVLPYSGTNTGISWAYRAMFSGCSSLDEIVCYYRGNATGTTFINNIGDWLAGVAASGTFYRVEGSRWANGPFGIPIDWRQVPLPYPVPNS